MAQPQVKEAIEEQRRKGSSAPSRSLPRTTSLSPSERRKAAALRFTARLQKEACVAKVARQKVAAKKSERAIGGRRSERVMTEVVVEKKETEAKHDTPRTAVAAGWRAAEKIAWAKKELRINMNLIAEMYEQGLSTSQQPGWAQKLHAAACRIQRCVLYFL